MRIVQNASVLLRVSPIFAVHTERSEANHEPFTGRNERAAATLRSFLRGAHKSSELSSVYVWKLCLPLITTWRRWKTFSGGLMSMKRYDGKEKAEDICERFSDHFITLRHLWTFLAAEINIAALLSELKKRSADACIKRVGVEITTYALQICRQAGAKSQILRRVSDHLHNAKRQFFNGLHGCGLVTRSKLYHAVSTLYINMSNLIDEKPRDEFKSNVLAPSLQSTFESNASELEDFMLRLGVLRTCVFDLSFMSTFVGGDLKLSSLTKSEASLSSSTMVGTNFLRCHVMQSVSSILSGKGDILDDRHGQSIHRNSVSSKVQIQEILHEAAWKVMSFLMTSACRKKTGGSAQSDDPKFLNKLLDCGFDALASEFSRSTKSVVHHKDSLRRVYDILSDSISLSHVGTLALHVGRWSHVAIVFDAREEKLKVYVNGALDFAYDHDVVNERTVDSASDAERVPSVPPYEGDSRQEDLKGGSFFLFGRSSQSILELCSEVSDDKSSLDLHSLDVQCPSYHPRGLEASHIALALLAVYSFGGAIATPTVGSVVQIPTFLMKNNIGEQELRSATVRSVSRKYPKRFKVELDFKHPTTKTRQNKVTLTLDRSMLFLETAENRNYDLSLNDRFLGSIEYLLNFDVRTAEDNASTRSNVRVDTSRSHKEGFVSESASQAIAVGHFRARSLRMLRGVLANPEAALNFLKFKSEAQSNGVSKLLKCILEWGTMDTARCVTERVSRLTGKKRVSASLACLAARLSEQVSLAALEVMADRVWSRLTCKTEQTTNVFHVPSPDLCVLSGRCYVSGNQITGESNFPTVRLNDVSVALGTGEWYYEATLLSDGLMQIGWCDSYFRGDSARGQGVGDNRHSWAFDGFRCKKWNGASDPYGERWRCGDVIGCFVRMNADQCEIRFYRNGSDMGVAFTARDITGSLYPAVSMNMGQSIHFNFGTEPFQYLPHIVESEKGSDMCRVPRAVSDAEPVVWLRRALLRSSYSHRRGSKGSKGESRPRESDASCIDEAEDEGAATSLSGRIPCIYPGDEDTDDFEGSDVDDYDATDANFVGGSCDERREILVDNLIAMGFPVEWCVRAAHESHVGLDENLAISWIIERMERESKSSPPKNISEEGNGKDEEEEHIGKHTAATRGVEEYSDYAGQSLRGEAADVHPMKRSGSGFSVFDSACAATYLMNSCGDAATRARMRERPKMKSYERLHLISTHTAMEALSALAEHSNLTDLWELSIAIEDALSITYARAIFVTISGHLRTLNLATTASVAIPKVPRPVSSLSAHAVSSYDAPLRCIRLAMVSTLQTRKNRRVMFELLRLSLYRVTPGNAALVRGSKSESSSKTSKVDQCAQTDVLGIYFGYKSVAARSLARLLLDLICNECSESISESGSSSDEDMDILSQSLPQNAMKRQLLKSAAFSKTTSAVLTKICSGPIKRSKSSKQAVVEKVCAKPEDNEPTILEHLTRLAVANMQGARESQGSIERETSKGTFLRLLCAPSDAIIKVHSHVEMSLWIIEFMLRASLAHDARVGGCVRRVCAFGDNKEDRGTDNCVRVSRATSNETVVDETARRKQEIKRREKYFSRLNDAVLSTPLFSALLDAIMLARGSTLSQQMGKRRFSPGYFGGFSASWLAKRAISLASGVVWLMLRRVKTHDFSTKPWAQSPRSFLAAIQGDQIAQCFSHQLQKERSRGATWSTELRRLFDLLVGCECLVNELSRAHLEKHHGEDVDLTSASSNMRIDLCVETIRQGVVALAWSEVRNIPRIGDDSNDGDDVVVTYHLECKEHVGSESFQTMYSYSGDGASGGEFEIEHLVQDSTYSFRIVAEVQRTVTKQRIVIASPTVRTEPHVPVSLAFDRNACGPNLHVRLDGVSCTNVVNKKWNTVRATAGFSSGVHQWEVHIDKCVSKNIFVGIGSEHVDLDNYVGSDCYGWGYLANKAIWHKKAKMRSYGLLFREGDVVRVTLDMNKGTLRFALNETALGLALPPGELCGLTLYPVFSLYNKGDTISLLPAKCASLSTRLGSNAHREVYRCAELVETLRRIRTKVPLRGTVLAEMSRILRLWKGNSIRWISMLDPSKEPSTLSLDTTTIAVAFHGGLAWLKAGCIVRDPKAETTLEIVGAARGFLWFRNVDYMGSEQQDGDVISRGAREERYHGRTRHQCKHLLPFDLRSEDVSKDTTSSSSSPSLPSDHDNNKKIHTMTASLRSTATETPWSNVVDPSLKDWWPCILARWASSDRTTTSSSRGDLIATTARIFSMHTAPETNPDEKARETTEINSPNKVSLSSSSSSCHGIDDTKEAFSGVWTVDMDKQLADLLSSLASHFEVFDELGIPFDIFSSVDEGAIAVSFPLLSDVPRTQLESRVVLLFCINARIRSIIPFLEESDVSTSGSSDHPSVSNFVAESKHMLFAGTKRAMMGWWIGRFATSDTSLSDKSHSGDQFADKKEKEQILERMVAERATTSSQLSTTSMEMVSIVGNRISTAQSSRHASSVYRPSVENAAAKYSLESPYLSPRAFNPIAERQDSGTKRTDDEAPSLFGLFCSNTERSRDLHTTWNATTNDSTTTQVESTRKLYIKISEEINLGKVSDFTIRANRLGISKIVPSVRPRATAASDARVCHSFKSLGRLVGMAIKTGVPLPIFSFPGVFRRLVDGERVTLRDIENIDPVGIALLDRLRNIQTAKNLSEADFESVVNALCPEATFTIPLLDQIDEVDECDGGEGENARFKDCVETTTTRRVGFKDIDAFAYALESRRKSEWGDHARAFRRGLRDALPFPALKIFNMEEIEEMAYGRRPGLSALFEFFESRTTYVPPYHPSHPAVLRWWRVLTSAELGAARRGAAIKALIEPVLLSGSRNHRKGPSDEARARRNTEATVSFSLVIAPPPPPLTCAFRSDPRIAKQDDVAPRANQRTKRLYVPFYSTDEAALGHISGALL
eukprot:g3796.t1